MRKVVWVVGAVMLFLALCSGALIYGTVQLFRGESPVARSARFQTKLIKQLVEPPYERSNPVPDELYQRVEYAGPNGKLWGWMSRPPAGEKRHPAIVWIPGGFPPGGLPDDAWLEQDPRNDQSGAQYMRAGVITLYPTTRGMEGNPGAQESFLGEVSDVVAAVRWLREQPSVDPEQVYVGGHSTGGTLSLLVGASTEVAGIVSFGPTSNVCDYGQTKLAFDTKSEEECSVRSPLSYAMRLPPSVIVEGEWGNGDDVRSLSLWPSKDTSYVAIPNCSHFLYVGALNEFFAQKIAKREALTFSVEKANELLAAKFPPILVKEAGWSVRMPSDFEEGPQELPFERVFTNGPATIVVAHGERDPVNCKTTGAIKGRGKECFRRRAETDDGDEWLYLTAQRGKALYVTAIGRADDEPWLISELNRVLDTAQAEPPDH